MVASRTIVQLLTVNNANSISSVVDVVWISYFVGWALLPPVTITVSLFILPPIESSFHHYSLPTVTIIASL